jgi:hypothetical protein
MYCCPMDFTKASCFHHNLLNCPSALFFAQRVVPCILRKLEVSWVTTSSYVICLTNSFSQFITPFLPHSWTVPLNIPSGHSSTGNSTSVKSQGRPAGCGTHMTNCDNNSGLYAYSATKWKLFKWPRQRLKKSCFLLTLG